MASYHLNQRGFGGIRDNFGIDLIVSFKDAKYDGLTSGSTSSFTTNTAGTKVRFINFNNSFERRLVFTFLSNSLAKLQENRINTSDADSRSSLAVSEAVKSRAKF